MQCIINSKKRELNIGLRHIEITLHLYQDMSCTDFTHISRMEKRTNIQNLSRMFNIIIIILSICGLFCKLKYFARRSKNAQHGKALTKILNYI